MYKFILIIFLILSFVQVSIGQNVSGFGKKNYAQRQFLYSKNQKIPQPPVFKPKMDLVKYTPFEADPKETRKPVRKPEEKRPKNQKTEPVAPAPRDSNPNTENTNPTKNKAEAISPLPAPPKSSKEEKAAAEADVLYKKQAKTLVDTAFAYLNVGYKSGGTTHEGVDCSGLVMMAYKAIGKSLPRTSAEMAKTGKEIIGFDTLKVGDLVFFDSNNAGKINHVGMITNIGEVEIRFIHSTISAGVVEHSLTGNYWKPRHRKTMRVL